MELKKEKISLLGVVIMIVVPVAGGGYGIEDLVGTAGPGVTMLVFIAIPFLWSLPFGLVAAEMSARYPENGGMYTWARNSLGEKAGFAAGWAYSVAGFIEPATFATLSANYIKMMFPFEVSHFSYWLICAILIAFFTIINFFGVKVLSNIATVVTIVCVVPFIVLIVLSFMDINYSPVSPIHPENMSFIQAAGQGLLIGIWFNTGYAQWVETEMIRVSITKDGVPQKGLAPYLFLIAETDGPDPMVLRGLFKEVGSGSSLFYQYAPQDGAAIPTGTYELWFDTQTPPDDSDAGPAEYLADSVEITYGDAYAVSTVFDYHTVGIEADPAYGAIGSVAISDAAGVLQPSQSNEIFAPDGHELVIETVTNSGYHFDGYSALGVTPIWEDDDPGKAGQKIEVQGTADIMAHGAPNDYTVKFDGNGSNVQGTMPDQDMVYGEPQNLFANQFTRPGGFFAVWTTNQDGGGDIITDKQSVKNLTTEDGGAVTLYAQWNMTTFNIDYDLNGGQLPAGKTNPDRYWADSPTFTLNAPVKEDYDFTGWMGTGLSNPVKKLTIKEGSVGDRAFIATWAIKQFTVKFVDNGGTGVDEQIVPIHKKAQKPKNPTRAGYAFKGWYADKKLTKAFDFNKEITKDTTVYAKWKKNAKPAGVLIAKVTAKGKKSMVVSWNNVKGAKGYDIFLARCDGKDGTKGMKKVKTVKAGKTLKWPKTGLKKKTAYKAYVKAYTVKDGKKKYIKTSPLTHAYTSGASKKYSNAKALTVNKKKITLKKGKTFKIKSKVTKVKKSKKLMPSKHVPTLRYISDNKKIAIVSKAGKITAKTKGTCAVYVYTHNGISKKIQVTVK